MFCWETATTLTGTESNCCEVFWLALAEPFFVPVDRSNTYADALEQILGVLVNIELASLAVLGEVEGGDLGNVLILALTLFLLQLERDTADGATLDTAHPVRFS